MNLDLHLLQCYRERADAFAYRELVATHAGMVFATARRVTRDASLAEDVAQETFLELARNSHAVTESVGAWLHRVAWRRACNAVRDEATRRRYESAAAEILHEPAEVTWEELEPQIDEALDQLPDKLREPLVEHFLEGRTQQEVAARLGVSQSTVSRALDSGVAELRLRLKNKGVRCGAGLALLLTANATQAAPATLTAALGKLAVSGIGGATATAGTSAWKPALAWLLHPAMMVAVVLIGAWAFLRVQSGKMPAPTAGPLPVATPAPVVKPLAPWRGRAFCPMCALPFTHNRRPAQGIFIHTEAGKDIIYDLQLPQPVPDFHQRYCGPSMKDREAASARGKTEERDGRNWLVADWLEIAAK